MQVRGAKDIASRLQRLTRAVGPAVGAGLRQSATRVILDVQEHASAPFQVIPSYLWEYSFHPESGARKYPKGTISSYSKLHGGGPDLPIQESALGTHHPIKEEIEATEPTEDVAGVVRVDVGYSEQTLQRHPTISWTFYGTRKMVPRPFLLDSIRRVQPEIIRDVATALNAVLRRQR